MADATAAQTIERDDTVRQGKGRRNAVVDHIHADGTAEISYMTRRRNITNIRTVTVPMSRLTLVRKGNRDLDAVAELDAYLDTARRDGRI